MRGSVFWLGGKGRSLGGGGLGGGGPRIELVKAVNDTAAHTTGCEAGWGVASKRSGGTRTPAGFGGIRTPPIFPGHSEGISSPSFPTMSIHEQL